MQDQGNQTASQEEPPWQQPTRQGTAPSGATGATEAANGPVNLCGSLGGNVNATMYTVCNAQGWLDGKGAESWLVFTVDPLAGLFDMRLLLEVVGGHAIM